MIKLIDINSVDRAVKEYVENGDFSTPFVICCTDSNEKDRVVTYVIDSVMGTKRVGAFTGNMPVHDISIEVNNAISRSCKYYSRKIYEGESLDDSDIEALSQNLAGNIIPVFAIVTWRITQKYAEQMPPTAYVY